MTDTAPANPYSPTSLSSDATPSGLTRLQAMLLTILALTLLLRGGFMLFSWAMQLSAGFKLDSHFYAAILTKDSIYGLSAFVGGLLLLPRHRAGWWLAMVHWCWYVACEICVVAAGVAFGWRVPVHHNPPTLYGVIGFTAAIAFAGIAILLWRPISTACKAPASKRHLRAMAVMIPSVALAFAVNWWMSLR